MIGVVTSDSGDQRIAAEFFELFKIAWQPYRSGQRYEAVLDMVGEPLECDAKLLVVYGSREFPVDGTRSSKGLPPIGSGRYLIWEEQRIPLYQRSRVFEVDNGPLCEYESGGVCAFWRNQGSRSAVRVGYDLLAEIGSLLTNGQPIEQAEIPTLELHIAFLRSLFIRAGVRFVELPPVPSGYSFVAALTHDVDHPSLRAHGADHTVAGFLYRALAGSIRQALKGRLRWLEVLRNWAAALQWPLVYAGLTSDPWLRFVEYPKLEGGAGRSTFFVIPFAKTPGKKGDGPAPHFRAAAYGAQDIQNEIRTLRNSGSEIGLHGIDAWWGVERAQMEFDEIRRVSDCSELGVRMHWLYFSDQTLEVLDKAGFDYDSTVGYNGTVGYRCGTGQVFKPLQASRLLELPLIVMDTALFYPDHLNLHPRDAWNRVKQLMNQATALGGAFTINWHDRSIFAERQWGEFYRSTVQELAGRGGWITTAANAVAWFRKRRSVSFDAVDWENGTLRLKPCSNFDHSTPALTARIYPGDGSCSEVSVPGATSDSAWVDVAWRAIQPHPSCT